MLLVIFGAGASYDSDPNRRPEVGIYSGLPDRPPLASQLFAPRPQFASDISQLPECKPIVPLLRASDAVEQTLERLQNEATEPPPYPQRLKQLAAVRWYLQVMLSACAERWHGQIQGITNYISLLDQILRWGNKEVLLVTFNYETLLERAITDLTGKRFNAVEDYTSPGAFQVIKPHGSTNWGRIIDNPPVITEDAWQAVHRFIEHTESLVITDQFVLTEARPIFMDPSTRRHLFPAIAIPVQTKQRFACPESHIQYLRNRLPEVQRVLVVGWRGADDHFVELLKEGLPKDVQCEIVGRGGADAREIGERLKSRHVFSDFTHIQDDFSGYVTQRRGDTLFRTQRRPSKDDALV